MTVEQNSFRFACPHCGQHLEADCEMVGEVFDCPSCGQPFSVPDVEENTPPQVLPVITVVKKRERFIDRFKSRIKAVGIGLAVLALFVGVGMIAAMQEESGASSGEAKKGAYSRGDAKAVQKAVGCMLDFFDMKTDRRLQTLANSLESCPADFQDAMKEFLVSITKTQDDMITDKDREDMVKGSVVFGLLFGAIDQDNPQRGVSAGLQLGGDLVRAGKEEAANSRLRAMIESKRNRLVDLAEKYGVDADQLKTALVRRGF